MPTAGAVDRCATTSATPSSTETSSPSATRRCAGGRGSAGKGCDVSEHGRGDSARLVEVMARLCGPATGCAWDVRQTFATVAPYTSEAAYEVADASDRGDMGDLGDEHGDLL